MTTRAVDKDGNFQFGNGLLNYKDGIQELKQNIITTIKSWKNDCFFDLEAGVDWNTYLTNYNTEELIKNDIIKNVKKIDGVINLIDYNSYLQDRKLNITFTIQSIYGNININNGDIVI